MKRDEYEFLCQLVHQNTAIVLGPGKEYLVQNRLQPVLAAAQLENLSQLVAHLRSNPRSPLVRAVAEALTTNETLFFRDKAPFAVLCEQVLPEILHNTQNQRRLRIWSAACSTGQEPYSLAMLLLDRFPQIRSWDVQILATDLSREVLQRAQEGLYTSLDISRGLPPEYQRRFFTPHGKLWQLSDEVKRMVQFRWCNLAAQWPAAEPQDLVLLRNVLIYLDEDTRRSILQRMAHAIKPEGYLFLGSSENPLYIHEQYDRKVKGLVIYYRPRLRKVA